MWVDALFGGSTGLFAVESGAGDGEMHSNTLFFETRRQWQCLLIEANPVYASRALQKFRKCHVLHGAISISGAAETLPFLLMGEVGGLTKSIPEANTSHRKFERLVYQLSDYKASSGDIVDVRTYPLDLIMRAVGRDAIDYWSLDTEGSEVEILEHTDFGQLEVGVLSVLICVCMYLSVCVCMCLYVCGCVFMPLYVPECVCMYLHVSYVSVCLYVCGCVHFCLCVCASLHAPLYFSVFLCFSLSLPLSPSHCTSS